jgi:hypothetical protein
VNTAFLYFVGGAAVAWFVARSIRESASDDGAPSGLGAPIVRKGNPFAQFARPNAKQMQQAKAVMARAQAIERTQSSVRAQQLDAYADSAIYQGFNRAFPLLPATLQGRF